MIFLIIGVSALIFGIVLCELSTHEKEIIKWRPWFYDIEMLCGLLFYVFMIIGMGMMTK